MTIRIEDIHTVAYSDVTVRGSDIPPTKPGDILLHDFLEPFGMSASALAMKLGVPANRITGIINGTRAVSAETALLLERYFGASAQFWMNLQTHYELILAQDEVGQKLSAITPREMDVA